ncbi:MAG: peptidylprolyl isomerase [Planctomycetota bacterium]
MIRRNVFAVGCTVSLFTLLTGSAAASTIISINTTEGPIFVRLFDEVTPNSVDNFLSYAEPGRYESTFIHRSPPGFVIQGGGFRMTDSIFDAEGIVTEADVPIGDEPGLTNVRGTLAFAKNSLGATSQWFFSIGDNSFLDAQDFTVFGRVIVGTMVFVDNINLLELVDAGVAENSPGEDFDELPIRTSLSTVQENGDVTPDDAVMVSGVTIFNFAQGDYNFDGQVSLADYEVWERQFGASLHIDEYVAGQTLTDMEADGNGDGRVDVADYTIWRDAFSAASGAATAAPEPTTAALALLGLIAVSSGCISRRRLAA